MTIVSTEICFSIYESTLVSEAVDWELENSRELTLVFRLTVEHAYRAIRWRYAHCLMFGPLVLVRGI